MAGLVAAAIIVALFLAPWGPRMVDLEVYRLGARAVLHGQDLYGVTLPTTDLVFTYPVFAAVLFIPFAVLPTAAAHAAMLLVSLTALWLVVHLTVRAVAKPGTDALRWSIPLAAAAVPAHPVLDTLLFGQINLVLVALVLADVLPWGAHGRDERRWRGVLVGIATGIKLVPGVFILYFVVTKQWRAAVTAGLTTVATMLVGFLVQPSASWAYWTDYAVNPDRVGGIAYVTNQSILGTTARLLRDPYPSKAFTTALGAVVLIAALVVARRLWRSGATLMSVCVVAVAGLLASPVSWSHHWVWFIPCVATLVPWALAGTHNSARARRWAALVAGAAVIAVGPMVYMPKTGLRELHHTLPQQIVTNCYLPLAVLYLVWAAVRAYSPRPAMEQVAEDQKAGPPRIEETPQPV